jgi:hypothetical protein
MVAALMRRVRATTPFLLLSVGSSRSWSWAVAGWNFAWLGRSPLARQPKYPPCHEPEIQPLQDYLDDRSTRGVTPPRRSL